MGYGDLEIVNICNSWGLAHNPDRSPDNKQRVKLPESHSDFRNMTAWKFLLAQNLKSSLFEIGRIPAHFLNSWLWDKLKLVFGSWKTDCPGLTPGQACIHCGNSASEPPQGCDPVTPALAAPYLPVWPWVSPLTSLSLSFLVWKMRLK